MSDDNNRKTKKRKKSITETFDEEKCRCYLDIHNRNIICKPCYTKIMSPNKDQNEDEILFKKWKFENEKIKKLYNKIINHIMDNNLLQQEMWCMKSSDRQEFKSTLLNILEES